MPAILLLCVFVMISCDSSKKDLQTRQLSAEESIFLAGAIYDNPPLKSSQVMITFSLDDTDPVRYDLFKLGIVDIIIEVDIGGEVIRHSLEGKLIPEDFYLGDSTPVDLTNPGLAYHYYGIFDVPAGKLTALEVAFSGSQSDIIFENQPLTLVDSLFALYPKVSDENVDQLAHQRFPFIARFTDFDTGITLAVDDLEILSIEMNRTHSVTEELPESADASIRYAHFTPFFTLKSIPKHSGFPVPFYLRFKEINDILFAKQDHPVMAIGTFEESLFTAEYEVLEPAELYMNGRAINHLENIQATADITLSGYLEINTLGYFYYLDFADITMITPEGETFVYEGIVKDVQNANYHLAGKQLNFANEYHLFNQGGIFSGVVENMSEQQISSGEFVRLVKSGDVTHMRQTHQMPTYTGQFFDMYSSLAIESDDLLNLKAVDQSKKLIVFDDDLRCDLFVLQCPEEAIIRQLDFSVANGSHTVLVVRRGEFLTVESETLFQKEKALIKRYDSAAELLDVLLRQKEKGYRIYRITGKGERIDDRFVFSENINIVALAPQVTPDSLRGPVESPKDIKQAWIPLLEGRKAASGKAGIAKDFLRFLRNFRNLFVYKPENLSSGTYVTLSGVKSHHMLTPHTFHEKRKPGQRKGNLFTVNNQAALNTTLVKGKKGQRLVVAPVNTGKAKNLEEKAVNETTKILPLGTKAVYERVQDQLHVYENISETLKSVDIPDVGKTRVIEARVAQLSDTLIAHRILSDYEIPAIRTPVINERLGNMSDQTFNATLNLRSNHSQLVSLLTLAGLFKTDEAAQERITLALEGVDVEKLYRGGVEGSKESLISLTEGMVEEEKSRLLLITSEETLSAGDTSGQPARTQRPLSEDAAAMVELITSKITVAEDTIETVKQQPSDLLKEIEAGKKLRPTPGTKKVLTGHEALLDEIRSHRVKLKARRPGIIAEAKRSYAPTGSFEDILSRAVPFPSKTGPDESATRQDDAAAGDFAGEDEWDRDERTFFSEQEKDIAEKVAREKAAREFTVRRNSQVDKTRISPIPAPAAPAPGEASDSSFKAYLEKRRRGIAGKGQK